MEILTGLRQRLYHRYTDGEIRDHDLTYLFLELTRRCNLSCIHCGSDCTSHVSGKELTTDSWLKIIEYIRTTFSPLPFIVLTGGEPLVHPDLFKITGTLKAGGFSWGMVTNGYTLNQGVIDRLIADAIHAITLSWDGDEEDINYIRNHPDAYDRISHALRVIGNAPIPSRDAVTCVYKGNLQKLDRISDELLEAGMNSHRLFRIFPKGRAAGNPNLNLSREESLGLVRWIAENRPAYRKKGLDLSFSCEGFLPFAEDLQVRQEPFFCRSGINFASVLADGNITGCNNNGPAFYQGNILNENFARVWEEEFKIYRDKEWMHSGICTGCTEWKYCRGGSVHLRTEGKAGPDFCYIKGSPENPD